MTVIVTRYCEILRLPLVLCAAVALGSTTGCGRVTQTPTNLLLITIDTLRADHLQPYGDTQLETPAALRLAREGIRFANAFTPVPLTLPAHSSILTGLQPFTHGVRDNGGFYLDPSHATLATMLKADGYQTAAFVSAFVLDSRWGLSNGFDQYFDHFDVSSGDLGAMARVQRPGGETWEAARHWLDEHANSQFFLWLHLFDPHTPYAPPEPFRAKYVDRPYDGEIAYADSIVGAALDYLERRHVLDRTVIALVGDHGEGLGEHGEDEHGLLLYESTLHVPWLIRLPDRARANTVIDRPVSLVDVAPTLLALLHQTPTAKFDGVDLSPVIAGAGRVGEEDIYSETFFPRLHFNWSELVSIRDDRYKLIRGGRSELFEYRRDVAEAHDRTASHATTAAALGARLQQLTANHSASPTAKAQDPDALRRLAALGYVAGAVSDESSPGATRPDPRDQTAIYRSVNHARELLAKGHAEEGIADLQRVVMADPTLEAARHLLRDYWMQSRQLARGFQWFAEQSRRRPEVVGLVVDAAQFARADGRLDEAHVLLQRALTMQSESVDALLADGEVMRDAGKIEQALALFRRAAERTSDPTPKMRVAETLIRLGRLSEADRVLTDALAQDAHLSGAHFLLAQIGEQQHDPTRAEREYRLEMQTSSWDYRAPFNLAALVAARGDHREQVALLESIPRIAPDFPDVYFYLAKALLDLGDPARLPDARAAAERALRAAPDAQSAPLGHYVLSDIDRIQGRADDAERELRAGQQLEQKLDRVSRGR